MGALRGWQGKVRIVTATQGNASGFEDAPDPRLTSAPFETSVDSEKVYVIGTRDAVDILMSTQEVSGSVERPFFSDNASNQIVHAGNGSAFTLAEVAGIEGGEPIECWMAIQPHSNTSFVFVLKGVKFRGWSFNVAAGDVTTERADFDATSINISTMTLE